MWSSWWSLSCWPRGRQHPLGLLSLVTDLEEKSESMSKRLQVQADAVGSIADTTPTKEADEKSIDMLVQDLAVQVAWGAGFPGLQHIEGAHCELVSEESRRALHALSAGRPGLQNIEGAH